MVADENDAQARRLEWERRQRRLRLGQNIGLVLLALGVLILVYEALAAATG